MKELYQQQRLKKILHSRYTLVVLCVIIILVGRGVVGMYDKYQKSKEILDRAESDLILLKEREQSIVRSMEILDTDYGKERELRDRFGVTKEGEMMVVIVDESKSDNQIMPLSEGTWWERVVQWFK